MADENLTLLQEKWRFWFNWLDIDGDGSLTADDWKLGAQTMIDAHRLDEDRARVAEASYNNIGKILLGENLKSAEKVTVEKFVDNLTKFYQQNSEKAHEYIFNVIRQLFLVADVNRDSLISKDEFVILMKSFGIKRENALEFYKEFKLWKREKVPMQEAINWWVDVWFGTDRTQWERIRKMHE